MSQYDQREQHVARDQYNVAGDQYIAERDIIIHQAPAEPQINLEEAEAAYRQQVIAHYNRLSLSGFERGDLRRREDVSLEDIFMHLTLTVEKVRRESVPPEELSETERRPGWQRERLIKMQEPIKLSQALGEHLVLVGEPGAGKSTLLRWLAVTFAQGVQREPDRLGPSADADRLPVLVELGRLPPDYLKPEGGESPNWLQFLPEHITGHPAFSGVPRQLLAQAMAAGRCLLLFDGLDEVADRQTRARLAHSLFELAGLSHGNRVIIDSRPAGVSESEGALRPQFQRCQIKRFTPEDVQRFFRFWYALDRDLTPEQQHGAADALYARVQATPAILQLASTPLLSTILVLIWRNEGDLPERRVELYRRCCRDLIKQWEAHHEVAYQGLLKEVGWECHLRLLAPLAYFIHSHRQTSATQAELIPKLAEGLQKEGLCSSHDAAIREAELFLETLSLRSGLLQYTGIDKSEHDRYGFPHQTFQEYLAARYIAAQPDPEYIDLVMAHLHEAWWQEVHLLTISHLGSGRETADKASALILTILNAYPPPWKILRYSKHTLLRALDPRKFLPQIHIERRIAWTLAREFEPVAKAYVECMPEGTTTTIGVRLSALASSLVEHIVYDEERYTVQKNLLASICRLPGDPGNAVVKILQKVLYHPIWFNKLFNKWSDGEDPAQERAAKILKQIAKDNPVAKSILIQALHAADGSVRRAAATSLGTIGVGRPDAISALIRALSDADGSLRRAAATSLGTIGVGNPDAISVLILKLPDADKKVRQIAAASLGTIGVGNPGVAKRLLRLLNSKEDSQHERINKTEVLELLGQIGIGNSVAVSALLELHRKSHWYDDDKEDILWQLEKSGIKDPMLQRRVLIVLNRHLYDILEETRETALELIYQLLDGYPFPE